MITTLAALFILAGSLVACGRAGEQTPSATLTISPPTPTRTPTFTVTPAPSATATPTGTPTPSPTPGPGLGELLLTPNALAAAADLEGALAAYAELAELYPQRAEPLLGQAAIAQRQSDWEAALDYLWAATEAEPQNIEAWRQLAILLTQQGKHAELVEVYGQMIERWPDDADLFVARAMTYARLGEPETAIGDLHAAQALDPYRQYAWLNVASAASGTRQYDAAIAVASAGLEVHPQSGGLLLTRGLALLSLGEHQAALDDFDAMLALDDASYRAYRWRGWALLQIEEYEAAIADLQRAGELGTQAGVTGFNEAFEAMADAADAMARSDSQAAFSYLAQYVFQYGSRDALLMGYARIDYRRGNIPLALGRLDSLVAGGYTPALYWRAVINAEKDEDEAAFADLLAYLEVRRSGPEVELARALLESLGGDPDAAGK